MILIRLPTIKMKIFTPLALVLILSGCAASEPGRFFQVITPEGTAFQMSFETTDDCLKQIPIMTKSAPPELTIRCSATSAGLPYGFYTQEGKQIVTKEFVTKDVCELARENEAEYMRNSFSNSPFLDDHGVRSVCLKLR